MLPCPLCGSSDLDEVFHADRSPVSIGLLRDTSETRVDMVTLHVVQCVRCGHVYNARFDDAKIRDAYTSTQYVVKKNVSPTMNKVEGRIFAELRPLLEPGARWLEIGSGNGALANQLAGIVAGVVTIDPSPAGDPVDPPPNREHRRAFFTRGDFPAGSFDGVVFRHLLEHVPDPNDLVTAVAELLRSGGHVYVEVPDFSEIEQHGRFMDVFHDHFSYFTEQRLTSLFSAGGFEPVTRMTFYEGQHQGMVFRKATRAAPAGGTAPARINGNRFRNALQTFTGLLAGVTGERLAVWGAGAHGNNISAHIAALGSDAQRNAFQLALDNDRSKRGRFLAALPARIDSADALDLNAIDGIVIASALHEADIAGYLKSRDYRGATLLTAKTIRLDEARA